MWSHGSPGPFQRRWAGQCIHDPPSCQQIAPVSVQGWEGWALEPPRDPGPAAGGQVPLLPPVLVLAPALAPILVPDWVPLEMEASFSQQAFVAAISGAPERWRDQ